MFAISIRQLDNQEKLQAIGCQTKERIHKRLR
jgi:hypothetical protein